MKDNLWHWGSPKNLQLFPTTISQTSQPEVSCCIAQMKVMSKVGTSTSQDVPRNLPMISFGSTSIQRINLLDVRIYQVVSIFPGHVSSTRAGERRERVYFSAEDQCKESMSRGRIMTESISFPTVRGRVCQSLASQSAPNLEIS